MRAKLDSGEIEPYVPDADYDDAEVPTDFDSATNWPHCAKIIGDIRDQSNCGCCWAFGGAEAASDRMCIASKGAMIMPLSAQDVCFNSNFDGCGGGMIDTPWTFIKRHGVVTFALLPTEPFNSDDPTQTTTRDTQDEGVWRACR